MSRNRLSKMRITRVSLVDRPAGVGAEVVLAKRDDSVEEVEKKERFFSAEERSDMAEEDVAMPDGSFPIPDKDALRRAIQSIGRAKNRAAAVKHIKHRAKKLGCEDMVAGLTETVEKSDEADDISSSAVKNNNNNSASANMSQAHADGHERNDMGTDGVSKGMKMKMKEAEEDMASESDMEDMDMEMPPARMKRKKMAKSESDLDTILKSAPEELVSYIERLEDIILDMQESGVAKADDDDEDDEEEDDEDIVAEDEDDADEADEADDEADDADEADDDDDEDEGDEPVTKYYTSDDDDLESILKGADARLARIVKSVVADAEKKASRAEKIAKRERDLRLHREYVAKAADLSALPAKQDDIVTLMSVVADKAPEVEDLLTSVLKAAHGALKESILFKSEGSDALDDNTAIAKFDAVVKEIRKADMSLSAEQAFAKALDSHPELYDEYLNSNTSKGR